MKKGAAFLAVALISAIPAPRNQALARDDGPQTSNQLSLADLAGYRAALSGKPTADLARASDLPLEATFKELWNRPDVFRGRRITIEGRVARIFRQGALGTFPALAEVWITSPAGDPFCVVFPQPQLIDDQPASSTEIDVAPTESPVAHNRAELIPEAGRRVRFTGTFLKMVRYEGGDGPRLAPLVAGDRVPSVVISESAGHTPQNATAIRPTRDNHSSAALELAFCAVGLAVLAVAAVFVARSHLRAPGPLAANRRASSPSIADPPLEFIEPQDSP